MSEAGSPVGAKQLRMQSLARSGQAEATLESEAGAPVTSIMQSLTLSDKQAATLASEAGAPVQTEHAESGREWSGGGTTLAIAQQFLTISKVILGPAAPGRPTPRPGQRPSPSRKFMETCVAGQCHAATVGDTPRVWSCYVRHIPSNSVTVVGMH